ncbi:MAG: DegT/DnrJ/EryC1/StrS aminotransferase family protein [Bacteroidales bacterium]
MIPFSPPRIDERIIAEVVDTLRSGWITTGPKTKEFEKRLTDYCGNGATLAVNSATSGLELVLRWFGIKEGDEVILPAYTYCATANVVIHCGAKPVMVDVNSTDFNINVQNIRRAINSKTKVIMPVDLAGFPCDYDEINALVKEPSINALFSPNTPPQKQLGRILILSDSAHSFGAKYKNKRSGSLADVSVFSFHAVKNLTTAEGGAIALNFQNSFDNSVLYNYLCTMSLHGQNKDALAKTKKGAWRYDVIDNGYKSNMTDLQASIGLVELDRYDTDMLPYRRGIYEQYEEAFKKETWAELPIYETEDKLSSFHVYCLRIKGIRQAERDQIIQEIFDQEVSVNVHFQPLPLLTAFKNRGYEMQDYPISYDNYSREISLPVWYGLDTLKVQTVIEAVCRSVRKVLNL